MKVGDRLYCWTNIDLNGRLLNITIGSIYVIHSTGFGLESDFLYSNTLNFFDDNDVEDWVSISKDSIWYYKYWFRDICELRKIKLDILGKSSFIGTEDF